ncbi:hypothetical protein [Halogeometricum limi]|uniref:Glycine zipper-like domain-containing protein n=1 Tax=Halogeometricum limi TaxID=555875 RepID=A0A1I6HZT3_9EURY|nr:hypothetical protein [Halogeometricum limi]SFR59972.1 hypothetical protein SAMN04488124_2648 [Halogeometricum limi]
MAQELTSGGDARSGEQSVVEYDVGAEESVIGSSSHAAEQFGVGATAGILVGALVGVAAGWALGGDPTVVFFLALGTGFILAPLVGLLVLERGD